MLPITTFVFDPPYYFVLPTFWTHHWSLQYHFWPVLMFLNENIWNTCLTGYDVCIQTDDYHLGIYSRRSLFQIFFSWISSHCHFVLLCAYWNIRKFTTTILLLDHSGWRSICVIILDIVSGALEPITHYSNPN